MITTQASHNVCPYNTKYIKTFCRYSDLMNVYKYEATHFRYWMLTCIFSKSMLVNGCKKHLLASVGCFTADLTELSSRESLIQLEKKLVFQRNAFFKHLRLFHGSKSSCSSSRNTTSIRTEPPPRHPLVKHHQLWLTVSICYFWCSHFHNLAISQNASLQPREHGCVHTLQRLRLCGEMHSGPLRPLQ